jgi:hypothetical protein
VQGRSDEGEREAFSQPSARARVRLATPDSVCILLFLRGFQTREFLGGHHFDVVRTLLNNQWPGLIGVQSPLCLFSIATCFIFGKTLHTCTTEGAMLEAVCPTSEKQTRAYAHKRTHTHTHNLPSSRRLKRTTRATYNTS